MSTIYTDYANGSDAASGSSGSPKKTLAGALAASVNGGTILVRGGNVDNEIYYERSLSSALTNLTIRPDTGHHPIFTPSDVYTSWALTSGNVYETTYTENLCTFAYNGPQKLTSTASVAACQALTNSFFFDNPGNKLHVNIGGSAPTRINAGRNAAEVCTFTGAGTTMSDIIVQWASQAWVFDSCTLVDLTCRYLTGGSTALRVIRNNGAGSRMTRVRITLDGGSYDAWIFNSTTASDTVISNCTLIGHFTAAAGDGIEFAGGTGHTVTDCLIVGTNEGGVRSKDSTVICERVTVRDQGRIAFYADNGSTMLCLESHTYLVTNTGRPETWGFVVDEDTTPANITCYHCTAANLERNTTPNPGVFAMAGFGINTSGTVIFKNCIAYRCGRGFGDTLSFTATRTEDYNCAHDNDVNNWVGFSAGANSITSDPLFVDQANDDYHLQATSPCIDEGVVIAGVNDDFYGVAPDMGRYEYVPPAVAAFIPTGSPSGLQLAILDEPDGRLLADFSPDVLSLSISDGPHGYELLQANADLILREAARHYGDRRALYVRLADGPEIVWEGRREDRRLNNVGHGLSSFGYWRAFFDAPYTALWSKSGTADWRPAVTTAGITPTNERFEMDNNNRLFIAPRQDEDYDQSTVGALTFASPHNSEREFLAVDFDYVLIAPADWTGRLAVATWEDYTPVGVWDVVSAGSPLVGTKSIVLSPGSNYRLIFMLFYDDPTPAAYTGETGESYLKITNLRMATTTRDRVNTTLGTDLTAGFAVVTPGSMANIYVGQQLRIAQGTADGETVVVTAVTATTFSATYANDHADTDTVNAIVVYADEIAASLVDYVETLNPGHINDSKAAITAHDVDLTDEVYEDAYPADILNYLAAKGDTSGQRWEVGIREGRRLFFRPIGTYGRTWYVDATSLELEDTADRLFNSVYALYQDGNGWNRRLDATTDELSVLRYGLTRRAAIPAMTTSSAQAAVHQAAALDYHSNPPPRQVLGFNELWTAGGAPVVDKWQVRHGDTIVLRNVDPGLLSDEQATSFRVGRATYDAAADVLAVEPELPIPPIVPMLINGVPFIPREIPPVPPAPVPPQPELPLPPMPELPLPPMPQLPLPPMPQLPLPGRG